MTQKTLDVAEFLSAMSRVVTQVCVVTTNGIGGRLGVTVSAFSSVSADPPLVLVCVNERSPAVAAIHENGCFCVNILAETQSEIADCFAGNSDTPFDFSCAAWQSLASGAPVQADATAVFDCQLHATHQAGTHQIFIGQVAAVAQTDAAPLAYSNRAYQALTLLSQELKP